MTTHSTALVTDSSSQLPNDIIKRFAIGVAAIPVIVDGQEFAEGVDLDADAFFALHRSGLESASTSQPSPGAFVDLYQAAAHAGAERVLSIHVGEQFSGTINSASVAAGLVDIPVQIIDTGTASFGVGACVWEAAELRSTGVSPDRIERHIATLVPQITTSVLFEVLDYVDASGRAELERPATGDDIAVYKGVGSDFEVIGQGQTPHELCELLAQPFAQHDQPIRAGIARADADTAGYTDTLIKAVRELAHVVEVVEYRVGPSIAVHSGPATAGGFFWPAL